MPTVTLNRKVFEKLVGKKLVEEELKERIAMIGTDLEEVTDEEITVEIFPDRPDWLSEQGFARSFSAFVGVNTGLRKYKVQKSGHKVIVDKNVGMRPYTACAIVKNIKFDDERIREVMQIQEKLAMTYGRNRKKSAYGLYPANKINFPIKYIAKDPHKVMFHALGTSKPMWANKVEEIHPTARKYSHIAEGWEEYPFFIDAKDKVMCMLPYTNSHDTGKIDESTEEVFIECTGTNLENVKTALNMLVTMLADMGGEIYSIDVEYGNKVITTPELKPKKMKVQLEYVNRVLGLELKDRELKTYLEMMGYGYEKGSALIPAYRADVIHQYDVIEDVAIAYGYENFDAIIPKVATIAQENKEDVFVKHLAKIFVGLGFTETNTYHIANKNDLVYRMKLGDEFGEQVVELDNALTEDYNALRNWMLPGLVKILGENKHNEFPQNLFEIGTVVKRAKKGDKLEGSSSETKVEEFKRMSFVIAHNNADFTQAKQVLEYVFRLLGVAHDINDVEHSSFIKGRVGRVTAMVDNDNRDVAYIGEISPAVLKEFEIEVPVVGVEINITELFDMLKDRF
jgi:phenylalanyl-tRNA synthetase beta chain